MSYILRLCVCLVLISEIQANHDPYGSTSGDILAACKSETEKHATYCVGYLKAYRDWYHSLHPWRHQVIASSFHYCEPKEFDYLLMKQAVVNYLENHPNVVNEPRIVGVSLALSDRWPCPNDDLRKIQELLKNFGYNPGKPDGLMNKSTEEAIRKFQKDHSLKITGTASVELLNKLLERDRELNTPPN